MGNQVALTSGPVILARKSGIDGTATGTTDLYTVPTGRTAVIFAAIPRLTAMTGFAAAGTAGVGVASGEDDILPAQVLVGLDEAGKGGLMLPTGAFRLAKGDEVVKFGIDVAFNATTATLAVVLIGYLL